MNNYMPIIGLEIHAELTTNTKLFCRCQNTSSQLNTQANSAVCPTCFGLPGALPVLNEAAVAATVKLGLSLGSTIPEVTKWDRKNYFYPDLPKGYQISQYDEPLCLGGELTWKDRTGDSHTVALTRIHLEEDTGKLTHVGAISLIDYNRSSIPLLELVTEPVIKSASEAKAFGEEYQHHLRDLGIAEASMEKGQMRCEANISIVPEGTEPDKRLTGTKVEVKNLNSFKSLEKAILYEIERQSRALARGEKLVQETRGWNEAKGETYAMRIKETSDDYRYFPEPDLYPLKVSDLDVEATTPSRADIKSKLIEAGARKDFTEKIANTPILRSYMTELIDEGLTPSYFATASKWLVQEPSITKLDVSPIKEAFELLEKREMTAEVFKQYLLLDSHNAIRPTLADFIALHSSDVSEIAKIVMQVLSDNQIDVARYKAGETQLFGFFIGQVKKALNGQGDVHAIGEELKQQLG